MWINATVLSKESRINLEGYNMVAILFSKNNHKSQANKEICWSLLQDLEEISSLELNTLYYLLKL